MINDKKIYHINGFLSTTPEKEIAKQFATSGADIKKDRHPVLFEFDFQYDFGYLNLNSPNFSKYCESEQEITIAGGLGYEIVEISEQNDLTVIKLNTYDSVHQNLKFKME